MKASRRSPSGGRSSAPHRRSISRKAASWSASVSIGFSCILDGPHILLRRFSKGSQGGAPENGSDGGYGDLSGGGGQGEGDGGVAVGAGADDSVAERAPAGAGDGEQHVHAAGRGAGGARRIGWRPSRRISRREGNLGAVGGRLLVAGLGERGGGQGGQHPSLLGQGGATGVGAGDGERVEARR